MALVLDVDVTAQTTDCGTLTVTDSTGNYNVSTNPTGWGAPNAVRSDYYIKLFVTLKKTTGDEPITIDTYNANTVTSWSVDITEDGYYNVYAFACLEFDAGITYAIGEIVFYDDEFYIAIASSVGDAPDTSENFEVLATVDQCRDAVDLPQDDVYESNFDYTTVCNGNKCFARSVRNRGCDCDEDCGCKEVADYEKIRLKLEAVDIHSDLGEYTKAQEIIENLNDICNCVD